MKKLLISFSMLAFVGAIVVGGTGAFFSDTETSTGNTFTAGAIDLQIDNESYYNGVFNQGTSWLQTDLNESHFFFNFIDLKPGDFGEDTISIHVDDNDSYACIDVRLDSDEDNGSTEPELEDENPYTGDDGELAEAVHFIWWADDGDNVLEDDEQVLQGGPLGDLDVGEIATVPLADSQGSIFAPEDLNNGALIGDQVYYVGKAWCFGGITPQPLPQDGETDEWSPADDNDLNQTAGQPADGGFLCDGSQEDNVTQTDSLTASISFFAVQRRHNDQFVCAPHLGDELERPNVGALLSAYVPPSRDTCDVVVLDTEDLQAAIDGASPGDLVCVDDGTYNEFTVDKPLTIAGLVNPETSATIVPSGPGVSDLALINSSDVTITGLHFDGTGTSFTASQVAGVRISPVASSIDNVHVTYNLIENLFVDGGNATASNKGIQWFTDTGSGFSLTNSSFMHNVIDDITSASKGGYGVQTVGDMDGVDIAFNTISNIDGAWEAGIALDSKDVVTTTDVSVNHNHVVDGIGTFSVQVEANVDGGGIVVNTNNLDTLLYGGSSGTPSPDTLNAEDNWWGTATPALGADVFVAPLTNVVDFDPAEGAAYPQN